MRALDDQLKLGQQRLPSFSQQQMNLFLPPSEKAASSVHANSPGQPQQHAPPPPMSSSRRYSQQTQHAHTHAPIETSVMEKSRDERGNKRINNYVLMHELGRGGFGKVRLAYHPEQNQYYVCTQHNSNYTTPRRP